MSPRGGAVVNPRGGHDSPAARHTVRDVCRLGAELVRLSRRRAPGLTAATLAVLAGSVVAVAGGALALRAAVDAAGRHAVPVALAGAAGAALGYALLVLVRDTADALILTLADRVGRLDVHPRIHLDLATLPGLEHLENTAYLDRITLVRKAGGRLAAGTWHTLKWAANVANLAVTLLLLGSVSPWLLALLPLAAVPVWCEQRGQRTVARADLATAEAYRLQQHLFELGTSAVAGRDIRVAGAGPELARRQRHAWRCAMRPRVRARLAATGWTLLGWTGFVAGFAGALALAAHRTAQGHGTPGDLVLLVTIAATLRSAIQSTVDSAATATAARQYLTPYLWLRGHAARARSAVAGSAAPPPALARGITLVDVGYRYPGTDRPALHAVSAHLPAGSVVAIVGEYGSGKSTLVKLLCRFYRPGTGRILVDGTDLAGLDVAAWRARCTAAFQDFGRFHTTLGINVGLGNLPDLADDRRLADALAEAGAGDLAGRLPRGLHTLLGRHLGGSELSEGQWQRTALARAALRPDPLLVLLDEPTASLDAPTEDAIFRQHMRRARDLATRTGAVTVIVTHRFSTVTGADLILVLDKGRLVESGDHRHLLAAGGRYARLYRLQAHAYRGGPGRGRRTAATR